MWKQSTNRQVSIVAANEGAIKSIQVKYTDEITFADKGEEIPFRRERQKKCQHDAMMGG